MKKEKKCKWCNENFTPFNSFQKFCFKTECIVKNNEVEREKKVRKAKKAFRENDKSTLLKLAQTIVNKYIRLRDLGKPCISCNYLGVNRKWNAGHFRPMGNNQQLRYYTLNIFLQCEQCNSFKSGNLIPYRENIINKLGIDKVEEIEANQERGNYSVEYLQKLIKVFRKKIKLYERKFRS